MTTRFSLVLVRHPNGLFLGVKESRDRGWWLPGGHVEQNEYFEQAAIRETEEEAGLSIVLEGVLAIESAELGALGGSRMRVVFLARPEDPSAPLKTEPDGESEGAEWLTLDQIAGLSQQRPPEGLRGPELHRWALYVNGGGTVYPLTVMRRESPGPTPTEIGGVVPRAGDTPTVSGTSGPDDWWTVVGIAEDGALRRALLAGADVEARQEKEWSALHHAVIRGDINAARWLLVGGADPNAGTHKGRTPLTMAVTRGSIPLIRLLLVAGADPHKRDAGGKSPLSWAEEQHPELVPFLEQAAQRGPASV